MHLGGSYEEIVADGKVIWKGERSENPFIILAQTSLFDPTRAPDGKQTVWAYCHVPAGSTFNMLERIENQIERFAPGFKDCILAKHCMNAQQFQEYNPNNIGGDIYGGIQDLCQLFTRPITQINPYATPIKGLYLCSSSTPPGPGVHGMCGYHAVHSL